MGLVVEARDLEMGRLVAIKGIRGDAAAAAAVRERFDREVRLQSRLAHPNILPIFDRWQDASGSPWCSMLRVPDRPDLSGPPTLGVLLGGMRESSPERRALGALLQTFLQICRGVEFAHAERIVHRDLKPDNVLMGPSGEALVADWGLAFDRANGTPHEMAGTPGYAAPEQLDPAAASRTDARTDVFGLGAILHELVTSRRLRAVPGPPFPRFDPAAEPIPETAFDPHVPRELVAIVRRACHPDPERRFPDVRSLRAAIEVHLEGGLVEGMDYSLVERIVKWTRRHPALAGAIATGSLLVTFITVQAIVSAAALAARLQDSKQSLALAHASAAATQFEADSIEGARTFAALAFQAAGEAPEGWKLPPGPVYRYFQGVYPPEPLQGAWTIGAPGVIPPRWVSFTADGKRLRVKKDMNQVVEISLDVGRPPSRMSLPGEIVRLDDVTAMGRILAIARPDSSIELFDVEKGTTIQRLVHGSGAPYAFILDSSKVLLASGKASLRDMSTGKSLGEFELGNELWASAFDSRLGLLAFADRNGTIQIHGAGPRKILEIRTGLPVLVMRFLPDGVTLLTAGGDDQIRLWDITTGEPTGTIGDNLRNILCLDLSPDGRTLASGGQDPAIHLWDLETRSLVRRLPGSHRWVWGLRFSPDGSHLASVDDAQGVFLWDVDFVKRGASAPEEPEFHTRMLDAGDRVVVQRGRSSIHVLDARTGEGFTRACPGRIDGIGLDGSSVVTAGVTTEAIVISITSIEVTTPAARAPWPLPDSGRMSVLAMAPDAGRVAAVSPDGRVLVWDPASSRLLRTLPAAPEPVSALALSPAGRWIATGRADGTVQVVGIGNGVLRRELTAEAPRVSSVTFARNDGLLLIGDGTGSVRLWDLENGDVELLPGLTMAPVEMMALDPRGRLLLVGGGSGMVVHDRRERGPRHELDILDQPVMGATFTRRGSCLAASVATEVRVLELDALEDPARHAARILERTHLRYDPDTGALRPANRLSRPVRGS